MTATKCWHVLADDVPAMTYWNSMVRCCFACSSLVVAVMIGFVVVACSPLVVSKIDTRLLRAGISVEKWLQCRLIPLLSHYYQ